ncbi:MAG: sugar phosphate isomerase/epimerase [Ruminococcaceae bacterium]|nr:sugar phosphate isomerase/epimerase [Oscillospiraceae bacterium]
MNIKYSVFISNVASCNDRYCSAYGRKFSIEEMFARVKSIPSISGVDIVLTEEFKKNLAVVKKCLKETGLTLASVAVDTFANPIYQKGSFAAIDENVRQKAIEDAKFAIDFASELGCKIVTLWPGQDGYDYMFAADYIKERKLFSDAVKELCEYNKNIDITLEYKLKEPRTHSYISTVGTTLMMLNDINCDNAGIALDYGHAVLGYENPAESVAMCKMYGDRLRHIHINDNYGVWDDDMIVANVHTIAYLEFLYWLKKTDYKGYITFDQFPYREDGRDAVSESAEWMSYLIELIDNADSKEIEKVIASGSPIEASKLIRKILKGN